MRIKHLKKILAPKAYLKRRYRKRVQRTPDLKNPKYFTELMQWRKLHDKNPVYTLISDKLAVRDYVKDKVGSGFLIPLIRSARNWDELDFNSLPETFIIKANHGSGWNEIVLEKSNADEPVLRRTCENWLKQNYYYGLLEWQYKDIKPRLIVEKLLRDENGRIPDDIKCYCFNINGDIEVVISVNQDRFDHHKLSFYDSDWQRLPFGIRLPQPVQDYPRPENLDEILLAARKLASDFSYVRVDLYNLSGKVYFGEYTLTPGSGLDPFDPDEWDIRLGEMALAAGIMQPYPNTSSPPPY